MVSLVPLIVIERVLLALVVKLTETLPLIDTPVTPEPSEIVPLKLPLLMCPPVSINEALPPVTRTIPLPTETVTFVRLRLPVPVLLMLPLTVPETETGPNVSLKDALMLALMVNWPLAKVTLMEPGPMPPVSMPLRPDGAMVRLPLIVTGTPAFWTVMLATATLMTPVVESRVNVRSPVSVMPLGGPIT